MMTAAINTGGKNSKLIPQIKSLFNDYDWGRGIVVSDNDARANQATTNKDLNKVFQQICEEHPEFFKALCYEAATGEEKFGKNSKNVPDLILEWSEDSESKIYTIDEYLNHKSWKPVIGFKTANDKTSTSLRIL
jgi:hypothetical protein